LAVSSRIRPGDYDSWYNAWNEFADRIAKDGDDQLSRNHRVSARDSFLRATSYYQSSEFFLHGNPKDPRITRAYQLSVDCYKRCAKLHEPLIEPVEIPYEKTTLPGYFHHADKTGEPRPTLIMHTGFDGSAEEMHVSGARAAIERGYSVLAFDDPGQYGPLHREGLVFRPDWEKVVTPVVDFALEQSSVDPKRIALMGISMGGLSGASCGRFRSAGARSCLGHTRAPAIALSGVRVRSGSDSEELTVNTAGSRLLFEQTSHLTSWFVGSEPPSGRPTRSLHPRERATLPELDDLGIERARGQR
jgi:hypothetical protein